MTLDTSELRARLRPTPEALRARTNTFQFLRLAAVLAAGMCVDKVQAQPENGIDVSYSIESSIQTVGAPLRLMFRVENHSADKIKLKLGRDRKGSFSFVLQRPDGTKIQLSPLPKRERIFDLGMVSLSPGEHLIHPLLLNEFARFEAPGRYGIEVRLETPIETGAGTQIHVDPYYGKFEIAPRDEKMLMATAEKLTKQIESSRSVREALDAAAALAFIDDPVAVPYLERALHSGQCQRTVGVSRGSRAPGASVHRCHHFGSTGQKGNRERSFSLSGRQRRGFRSNAPSLREVEVGEQ